jgi:hypothetical protein
MNRTKLISGAVAKEFKNLPVKTKNNNMKFRTDKYGDEWLKYIPKGYEWFIYYTTFVDQNEAMNYNNIQWENELKFIYTNI